MNYRPDEHHDLDVLLNCIEQPGSFGQVRLRSHRRTGPAVGFWVKPHQAINEPHTEQDSQAGLTKPSGDRHCGSGLMQRAAKNCQWHLLSSDTLFPPATASSSVPSSHCKVKGKGMSTQPRQDAGLGGHSLHRPWFKSSP